MWKQHEPEVDSLRRLLNDGDLVAIPVPDGTWVLAHVLFASSVFKDMVLLGVFEGLLDAPALPTQLPESYAFEPIYTGSIGVRKSGWKVVGHRGVTPEERKLSLRITGGQVWLGDDCLGDATDEDYKNLRQMVVFGYPYLMKKVRENIARNRIGSGDSDDSR